MFGTHDLALFVVSGLLLNIAPGPDSLLIITRSAPPGWRAGSAAALGIGTGTFVHIFAAALGLSAVLASSATAFTVVKWLGAAYLMWMGLAMLRRPCGTATWAELPPAAALPYRTIYRQGFFTNALNPKVALFFLAFVPQFIAPEASSKALAFVALGCLFNFNSMLWCHFLALSTAYARRRLRVGQRAGVWGQRIVGAMFLLLGLRLALSQRG